MLLADFRLEVTANVKIKCMIGAATLIAIGSSQPSIEAWGSSQPSIVARESSKPSIVAWESSKPSIVAWGSSQPSIEARESSQPSIEAWGSSQPSIVARESSKPSIVAWGSSQPSIEARESSKPSIVAWGSSQPSIVARESSKPSIVAWESSKPSIVAWGSSQPSIEARESSQPSIEAWGSSQPSIVARESSKPSIEARGVCQISVRGAVNVKAGKLVAIVVQGTTAVIDGGGFIARVDNSTPAAWCEYYGVETDGESAVLYKCVDSEFRAKWNSFLYAPGTAPSAPDWNPAVECGGGLHFSPSPRHALEFFDPPARRFVACRIQLNEIVTHPDGDYPQKCKAPRVLEIWEVDIDGKRVESAEAAE